MSVATWFVTWAQEAAFVIGLVITLVLGLFVSRVLKNVKLQLPLDIDPGLREKLLDLMTYGEEPIQSDGKILGWLELFLFFTSLWMEAYLVIPGWLAFKLGSKWQTWQHIIKMPSDLLGTGNDDSLENLRLRSACGSYQMSRFLIGTLYNVLCGLGGVFVGRILLKRLCS